jgi:pimeloyl-ACP methyl ester carboxylesterase
LMECLMIALRSIRLAFARCFHWFLAALILCPAFCLSAQAPIINDTTTQYTIGLYDAGCFGTCDLSPSYNGYTAPAPFSITKITLNFTNGGYNNCDENGHYGAIISSNGNASGTIAVSTNSVYMGCAGTSGSVELDFAGQIIAPNFNLDFAAFDGVLQGGSGITVSGVEIWGNSLGASGVPQIGLPVLFVHGICDTADSFLPTEQAVKGYLAQNASTAYSTASMQEYVAYYDENNNEVWFQLPQSQLGQGATNPPLNPAQVPSTARFFLVALDDPGVSGYQNFLTNSVAQIPIYQKGNELAQVIASIREITNAPRVVVVGHSMGGLDARSYIEGLASPIALVNQTVPSNTTPYLNEIAELITLDTPHGGVTIGDINLNETLFETCAVNASVDKSEMLPSGTDNSTGLPVVSIIPTLNYGAPGALPLPPGLSVTSIASSWTVPSLPVPPFLGVGSDDILTSQEQDLASNLTNPAANSESAMIGDANTFGLAEQVYAPLCGTVYPLHQLNCTGSAPQTFGIIGPAVLASSVIFPDAIQISPSVLGVPPQVSNVFFASSAGRTTLWSIFEGSAGGSIYASSTSGCPGTPATTGAYACYNAPTSARSDAVFHIVATNSANPSQTAIAIVAIYPDVSILTQTIDFVPLPNPTVFGVLPLTMTATATSGLPVTFRVVSGPATVSGNSLTITGAGAVVVTADQAGNATYAPAESQQTVVVTNPVQGALFNQTDSSATSRYSNWSGNWYQLGTGYSGLLNSIDIFCDVSDGGGSSVDLSEFADSGYSTMTNQFQLSGINGNPSCTGQMAQVHFANLNIPLWANRYYRLDTGGGDLYADVAVLGTQSEGYAMDENWYYGYGVAYDYYQFYPFILSNVSSTPTVPPITWAAPPAINYGAALSATQLDASSTVSGVFTYSPAMGAVLGAGTQTLSVTFAPADTTDYTTATAMVALLVNKATSTVAFTGAPASAGFGSTFQVSATTNSSSTAVISASGACSVTGNTVTITSGTGICSVTATWAADSNYLFASANQSTTATKIAPTVVFTGAPVNASYEGTFSVLATTNASTTAVVTSSGSCSITGTTVSVTAPSGMCSLTATWAGDNNYLPASVTQSTTATKATPLITWAAPAAITYGTALSATQLNATTTYNGSTIAGTFVYSPVKGTVLGAGSQTLSVTFTPTKTTDFTGASASVVLQVNQRTPKITWAKPAAITDGTALSSTQLDATASVPGAFVYSPAAGTSLNAGTQSLSVTFTPTDSVDYSTATDSVSLTVNKATPTVTWATPAAITYGTPLSSAELDATASVPGTFAYLPAAGTVPAGGTDTLSVTFTPTDSTDYTTAKASVALQVTASTPTITWTTPAAITYGTALSGTQLNATATFQGTKVAGTFTYTPAKGTLLGAGTQTLSVVFKPANSSDYISATASVTLRVNQATPKIAWPKPAAISYGTALSGTQLDATASVPGTFVYSPASGTILAAGTQALSVIFAPTDSADYTTQNATTTITVKR